MTDAYPLPEPRLVPAGDARISVTDVGTGRPLV